MHHGTGAFVVIEGLDGSGGTTQVNLLREAWVRREPTRTVNITREPSDGPVGKLIRGQLVGGVLGDGVLPYLFAADRRDHLDRVVLPHVARGEVVISDRYALSSLAYQSEVLGLERVWALNAAFPAPAITVMLMLSPEQCVERIERRGRVLDRFENLERLRRVEAAYAAATERATAAGWNIVFVNADQPVEKVAARVQGEVFASVLGAQADRA